VVKSHGAIIGWRRPGANTGNCDEGRNRVLLASYLRFGATPDEPGPISPPELATISIIGPNHFPGQALSIGETINDTMTNRSLKITIMVFAVVEAIAIVFLILYLVKK
jgi:hypothetical protein